MKKHMQALRLLCMVLVILLACAALVTHSHECSGVRCAECTVRRALSCAVLVLGGRLALFLVVQGQWLERNLQPAQSRETLVQMKVKLSN